jgi:hypothetical protein
MEVSSRPIRLRGRYWPIDLVVDVEVLRACSSSLSLMPLIRLSHTVSDASTRIWPCFSSSTCCHSTWRSSGGRDSSASAISAAGRLLTSRVSSLV